MENPTSRLTASLVSGENFLPGFQMVGHLLAISSRDREMGMRESFFILGNTSSSLVIFFILKFALSAINIVFLASFQFYVTYFGNFSL